jgi:hypothetical protein
MAVLAIFTGAITKAQYETLRFTVDWARNNPPGAVLHAAAFDDSGQIHVADLWESAEDLDAFVTRRLLPLMDALKIQPPELCVYPVHAIHAYQAIDSYRL